MEVYVVLLQVVQNFEYNKIINISDIRATGFKESNFICVCKDSLGFAG